MLGALEDGILFQAEVFMKETNMAQNILAFINQKFNGKYGRSHNSIQEIETCIGRYVYVPLALILCCVALFMHVAF